MGEYAAAEGKRSSDYKHAKVRAAERWGISLHREDWEAMSRAIAERRIRCEWLRPDVQEGRHIVAVWAEDEWLPVVFDERTRTVVTFLPPHALDRYREFLDGSQAGGC